MQATQQPKLSIYFYTEKENEQTILLFKRKETVKEDVQKEDGKEQNEKAEDLTQYTQFQTLHGVIEDEDSNTKTLAGARIIMGQLSADFRVHHLLGQKSYKETLESESQRRGRIANEDWLDVWRHPGYYEWMDYLSDLDFVHDKSKSQIVYFLKVETDKGLENLLALEQDGIEVRKFTEKEILKEWSQVKIQLDKEREKAQRKQSMLSTSQSSSGSDNEDQEEGESQSNSPQVVNIVLPATISTLHHFKLSKTTQKQKAFLSQPPCKESTFIQFICKPQEHLHFVEGRPYIPVNALYKGQFREAYERWYTYHVACGELPTDDVLEKARAILIPGSGAGAWEDKEWIVKLKQFLVRTHANFPHIKIIGICFGMQVISEAFGGKVIQLEQRKQDPNYHVTGNEPIEMSEEFANLDFVQKLDLKDRKLDFLGINKGHGDVVVQLPPNFQNMGRSKTTHNEVIVSQDKRIIGFQGHPEYSYEWSKRKLAEFNSYQEPLKVLQCAVFKSLFTYSNDHKLICEMILKFIKGDKSNFEKYFDEEVEVN